MRSGSERKRHLEGWVGGAGKVKVWLSGDQWNYAIMCRTCWARPPQDGKPGEKVLIGAGTTAEAVARWLQHEATHGVSDDEACTTDHL